ncbi:monocarboxylate transporter 14 [Bacillus rossius redtenbacheri]|uniref:monocarboxylate transporter 14 n=1 Tax=Bacillus rossius redtenbacheri TaxID=93214 RepID=UPI002FDE855C
MAAKTTPAKKLVAPDGGWGWMVVLGASFINLASRSIEPSFGLLFGDKLSDLGIETTGASLIVSLQDGMINFSGLFVGPLIKKFSYRKVGLAGATLAATAILLTSPAASMAHILTTYSLMGGLGVGFATTSGFVALNHYFVKYRGQAVGLSMAGTAVGFMLMPQLVQLVIREYGFTGSVLLLGGVSLHSIVGSLLLQPIKWHLRPAGEEEGNGTPAEEKQKEAQKPLLRQPRIEVSRAGDDAEAQRAGGKRPLMPRITSTASLSAVQLRRKQSVISNMSSMDFTGSSFHIHPPVHDDEEGHSGGKKAHEAESYWKRFAHFMDLDLLKDPSYLNILFGLSTFYVAELNFKMVVPFFFANLGYNKVDTAFFLSMTAIADVIARVVLPPICDRVSIRRRTLFMVAGVFLGISRSALAEQTSYVYLMSWLVLNGFLRGATLINFTLTISEHCSLEKLPAAFGLHMVAKGIFILTLGPVIGIIRDYTGSYAACIHAQTVCVYVCILAWSIEYLYVAVCGKKGDAGEDADAQATRSA